MARDARADDGRPAIEFLDGPDDGVRHAPVKRRRHLVVAAIAVGGIALAFVTVTLRGSTDGPDVRPVRGPGRCDAGRCAVPGLPTEAMSALIGRRLPGSVAVAEHTVLSPRHRSVISSRSVEVVSGNVVIEIAVRPLSDPVSNPVSDPVSDRSAPVDLVHGPYRVEYRFRGHYPPTRAQLVRLTRDPRLTSARA
ncbi:hypothetical protein [Jatrophihabitans endophyticus]|uniref:hypothetical protein n=1 Tax=Jatrophihabitans endophyticus TaxID=1206085 RepID=UPI0019E6CF2F|nr:hypothetical protein [Jatrophihabitans endophyticus]MBE7187944.1 hypothetical protein [Jatrophihabitans endophyticus]